MNKEKEIKEFADEIRRTRESYFGQADYLFAKKLFEDGYRKQIVGEWASRLIWLEDRQDVRFKCSICGNEENKASLFCPNCGTTMEGGAE